MKHPTVLAYILILTATPAFAAGSSYSGSKNGPPTLSFDQLDADGDGRLSEAEAEMATFTFLDMDLNRDGEISREEFSASTGIGETAADRAAVEETEEATREATSDEQSATIEPESPDPGSATATG